MLVLPHSLRGASLYPTLFFSLSFFILVWLPLMRRRWLRTKVLRMLVQDWETGRIHSQLRRQHLLSRVNSRQCFGWQMRKKELFSIQGQEGEKLCSCCFWQVFWGHMATMCVCVCFCGCTVSIDKCVGLAFVLYYGPCVSIRSYHCRQRETLQSPEWEENLCDYILCYANTLQAHIILQKPLKFFATEDVNVRISVSH